CLSTFDITLSYHPTATTYIYTLSLHDALPILGASLTITEVDHKNQSATLTIESSNLKAVTVSGDLIPRLIDEIPIIALLATQARSEEHTSELQSRFDLVCRLLLEKKK